MTRYRALLGCAAIAAMIALGFPGLTAMASDGTEPPTEPVASGDATSDELPAEPVVSPDPPTPPTPTEMTPAEPPAEPAAPPTEVAEPPAEPAAPPTEMAEPPAEPAAPPTETATRPAGTETNDQVATEPTTTVAPAPALTVAAAAMPVAPTSPRSLTATPGLGQVTLGWAPSISNGGSPIGGFTISYAPGGGSWTSVNVSASTRARTITGLRSGTGYYFRIAAYNSVGHSPFTNSVKAVPIAYRTPGAPAINSVTTGNQSVGLYWSPPANNGGKPITHYQIQIGSAGVWRNLTFVPGTQRAYKATGLVNGRTYSFRVRAANAVGWSPVWSNAVRAVPVAPAPLPPPPPPVTFGGGTYRVGIDIPAGTYRSPRSTSDWCYWERLSGFSGNFDDIIDNDFIDGTGPFVVTIQPSDRGFFAEQVCGTWTKIG